MKNNWIYTHEEKIKVRYTLGQEGKNPLICIGINPSTAKPNDLDPTLTRVKNIAQYNGYDGWVMLNVYPLRETNPDKLDEAQIDRIVSRNINEIKVLLKKYPSSDIWCAWGTVVEKRKYLKSCLKNILQDLLSNRNLLCVCHTKKGHPKHPLYCKKESQLISFDIEHYDYIH
jgi:hypothetical protein